ncbi:MAG: DNA repair protein RadC [Flavobacteriales bacterium]|nr:DNA repair protein RadC [Flavobacteriales bacterium]
MEREMLDEGNIRDWQPDDRPREKLVGKGVQALSDAELLAILLGSGTKKLTAVGLARSVLSTAGGNLIELGNMSFARLQKIHGMGEAKSATVVAALELGRRRRAAASLERKKITSSQDVFEYMVGVLGDLRHEEFWVLLLSRANQVIGLKKVSEGGVSSTTVDPKRIFGCALETGASSIIVAHNHPSGNREPSQQDKTLTQRLRQAGSVLECPLLDHLIITSTHYFSFADEGLLT